MQTIDIETTINPFMLMMEPDTVIRAMRRSSGLRGLEHHKYRPLDRPWIPFSTTQKTVESLVRAPEVERRSVPRSKPH